ncbi:MAG: sporulation protein YtfJ [Firmicutes bacterium]|nr:sporulation protein YtfJ [Bacillota bacterium]
MNIIGPLQPDNERPVERVMDNAFSKMRSLVDADIVIGTPVYTADGASIIPVNRVTMGFVTGGGEYGAQPETVGGYPFAGGSGAGVSVAPICFLVSDGKSIKLVNMDEKSPLDKLLGLIPQTVGAIVKGATSPKGENSCKNKK